MKVGDLVRFKRDEESPFGMPSSHLKVILSEPQETFNLYTCTTYVTIYYLEGPRAGQKSPCDIDMLEVVSESR
jgi:hypothetical protein